MATTFFATVSQSFADVPVDAANSNAIPVQTFLAASEEVVRMFDFLNGTAFAPVKSDLSGNIKKIREKYQTDTQKYATLQAIVREEASLPQKQRIATEGLLWLRRGLEFTSVALRRNLTDRDEELSTSFNKAYEVTLKQYHNMFIRPIFSLAMKACPHRKDFYVKLGGDNVEATYATIEPWLAGLEKQLQILKVFYDDGKYATYLVQPRY